MGLKSSSLPEKGLNWDCAAFISLVGASESDLRLAKFVFPGAQLTRLYTKPATRFSS